MNFFLKKLAEYFNKEITSENFISLRKRYNANVNLHNKGNKSKIRNGDLTDLETRRKRTLNTKYRQVFKQQRGKRVNVILNGILLESGVNIPTGQAEGLG